MSFDTILEKLSKASNYSWGTDEDLFYSAIDDLKNMPGDMEDKLKALNEKLPNFKRTIKSPTGGDIEIPAFGKITSLEDLVKDEFEGQELRSVQKRLGFDAVNRGGRVIKAEPVDIDNPAPAEKKEPAFEPLPEPKPLPEPAQNNPVAEAEAEAPANPVRDVDAPIPGSFRAAQLNRAAQRQKSASAPTPNAGDRTQKFLADSAQNILDQENSIRENRQFQRDSYSKEGGLMDQWIDRNTTLNNAGQRVATNERADKILRKFGSDPRLWDDAVKNSFIRNYNLGNLDDPAPAPTTAPIYGKEGLIGHQSLEDMEREMGGKSIKVGDMPVSREQQMIDEIQAEIDRSGVSPFGPEAQAAYNRSKNPRHYTEEFDNKLKADARANVINKQASQGVDFARAYAPQDILNMAPPMPKAPTSVDFSKAAQDYNTMNVLDERASAALDVKNTLDSMHPLGTYKPGTKGLGPSNQPQYNPTVPKYEPFSNLSGQNRSALVKPVRDDVNDILDQAPIPKPSSFPKYVDRPVSRPTPSDPNWKSPVVKKFVGDEIRKKRFLGLPYTL